MRIIGEKVDILYEKTKLFYVDRAKKYDPEHPYIATMYQDSHPEIAEERNRIEISKILPLLHLTTSSRVLDLGCGVGRWADAISQGICSYLGCDFSEDLISIAKQRIKKENFTFECLSATEIGEFYQRNCIPSATHIIISGVMMYLNDNDVNEIFLSLDNLTTEGAVVYLREPMGISNRLTLKDYYSEELQHEYNTIYRTRDEYLDMLTSQAPAFTVCEHGPMFHDAVLNNRKETAQYYFILKKERRM